MIQTRVYRCFNCNEFIYEDADQCRFCRISIEPEAADLAATLQQKENTNYRRRIYTRHIFTGLPLAIAGFTALLIAFSLPIKGRVIGFFWGLFLAGTGNFLYGLVGRIRNKG